MENYSIEKENFLITTDKTQLNIALIHEFLCEESYWAKNIPIEVVKQSIKNSLTFGLYFENRQIGFARIISDYITFAYLCDVFILEEFRGNKLSQWLLETIQAHPNLQNLRRWMLMTLDAQGVYKKNGWQVAEHPDRVMEITFPEIYQKK